MLGLASYFMMKEECQRKRNQTLRPTPVSDEQYSAVGETFKRPPLMSQPLLCSEQGQG